MNRTVIILSLFAVLLSVSAYGQHSKARLDKKMERQLNKNWMKELDLNGFYRDPDPGYSKFMLDFISGIEDWVWGGDTAALYVNVLKCKDDKIFRYVEKKVIKRYRNRTIYEQEDMLSMFRIDTINNETILCFGVMENIEGFDFYEGIEYRLEGDLKGVWYVDNKPVLLYGNILDKYFDIVEHAPMKAPYPPHKTIFKHADKRYTKPFPKSKKYGMICKEYYMTYKNKKLITYPNTNLNLWHEEKSSIGNDEKSSIENDEKYLNYIKKLSKIHNK